MKAQESGSKKRKGAIKPKSSDTAQSMRFRKAARDAGVDPNADIDEVMRRLAAQPKPEKKRRSE